MRYSSPPAGKGYSSIIRSSASGVTPTRPPRISASIGTRPAACTASTCSGSSPKGSIDLSRPTRRPHGEEARATAGAAYVHLAAMRAVSNHGNRFGLAAILRDAPCGLSSGLRSELWRAHPIQMEYALPRQRGRAHQELVDRVCGLAAFADRPHHQRLAASHVAAGEHFRVRAAIGDRIGLDVAAQVKLELEVGDHTLVHRVHETHCEQHKLGLHVELGARDRLELVVDARAMQRLHAPSLAREAHGPDREIALNAFLMAR